jgi:hypothetical protein
MTVIHLGCDPDTKTGSKIGDMLALLDSIKEKLVELEALVSPEEEDEVGDQGDWQCAAYVARMNKK